MDERLNAYALGQAPLVRALTEAGYAAGARHVDVQYLGRRVRRAFVDGAPDDMLGWTPPARSTSRWPGSSRAAPPSRSSKAAPG